MILDRLSRADLRADVSWADWDDRWYRADPSMGSSFAGFPITPNSAKRASAVFACTSKIAEIVASLPRSLMRRLDNGGKEKATEHPAYRAVRYRPNSWMTAMDFYGGQQMHLGLRGNSISEIIASRTGVELWPIHPDHVRIEQLSTNRLRYRITQPGQAARTLSQDEVLHVRDLSEDGIVGQARAMLAREAIAVAAAGEAFVGGFFKNDATGRVVISREGNPPGDEKIRKQQREEFQAEYAGWANRSKVLNLWNKATISEIGRDLDGNFIVDPRKFQIADIARFWGVPLWLIGLEEKSTSWGSGIEQQLIAFVSLTIKAWTDRWAQAMMMALLSEDEQEEYVIEFNFNDLVRGDIKSRFEAYKLGREIGMYSPNDLLAKENESPRDGGDIYQDTLQGTAPNPSADPSATSPAPDPSSEDVAASSLHPALVADAAARIAGAENQELEKRLPKAAADGAKFVAWAREHFAAQCAYSIKVLAPLADAMGLARWVAEQTAERIELAAFAAIDLGITAAWIEQRPTEIAGLIQETFRAGRAVRRAA